MFLLQYLTYSLWLVLVSPESPLTFAAHLDNVVELIKVLKNGGAHLDFRAKDGMTALHKAARSKNLVTLTVNEPFLNLFFFYPALPFHLVDSSKLQYKRDHFISRSDSAIFMQCNSRFKWRQTCHLAAQWDDKGMTLLRAALVKCRLKMRKYKDFAVSPFWVLRHAKSVLSFRSL